MAQAVLFQKALSASGASPDEIVQILAKVCDPKYTDDQVASLMKRALERRGSVTPEDLEAIMKLQSSLRYQMMIAFSSCIERTANSYK